MSQNFKTDSVLLRIVLNFDNTIVPVYEFITSEHTATNIEYMLSFYKNFITRKFPNSWPVFNHMVVDWSWAEINAIQRTKINDLHKFTVRKQVR